MKITEFLLGEHGVFYALFNRLEQALSDTESRDVVQELAALLDAALASHARLEDELLFAALEPRIGPMGPLAVMRMEHDQIERLLGWAQERPDVASARRQCEDAVRVAREHFAKEEQVLFPLAEQVLSAEQLADLAVQWTGRRGVTLQQG